MKRLADYLGVAVGIALGLAAGSMAGIMLGRDVPPLEAYLLLAGAVLAVLTAYAIWLHTGGVDMPQDNYPTIAHCEGGGGRVSAIATALTVEQIERLREWSATQGMGWHLRNALWLDELGDWTWYTARPVVGTHSVWRPDTNANHALALAMRTNLWWDYALGHSGDIGFFVFNWGTASERPHGSPDTTLAVAETVPMAVLLAVAVKCGYDWGATTEVVV